MSAKRQGIDAKVSADPGGDFIVASIPKAGNEEVRITLQDFKGTCQISIRVIERAVPQGDGLAFDFLAARCEVPLERPLSPALRARYEVKADRLRAAYEAWCRAQGFDAIGRKAFGSQLIASGIRTRKSRGLTVYVGLRLKAEA